MRNNGTCWDWQVFFFTSEGFEDFSWPEAITDSPSKHVCVNLIYRVYKPHIKKWVIITSRTHCLHCQDENVWYFTACNKPNWNCKIFIALWEIPSLLGHLTFDISRLFFSITMSCIIHDIVIEKKYSWYVFVNIPIK